MLKHELNVLIGVAACAAIAGVAIPAGTLLESFYRRTAIAEKGATMARVLAAPLAIALEKPDDPGTGKRLDEVLAGLRRASDLVGEAHLDLEQLAVLDAQGRLMATSGGVEKKDLAQDPLVQRARVETESDVLVSYPPNKWGKDGAALALFAAPLRTPAGEPRGTLWFSLSLERARWFFWQTFLVLLAGIVSGAIVVWFVLYKLLKRRILSPIVQLSQGIEKVRAGDLGARVALERKDEFGNLIESFNDLVAILRQQPEIERRLDEARRLEVANLKLQESHQRLAEAHKELEATKEQLALREKQASFQRFVRSIAHELKNPLNSANAAIEPLSQSTERLLAAVEAKLGKDAATEEDREDARTALGLLRRSVGRAVSIIHDLQGFAQLGKGDLVACDLKRIIEDALLSVQPLLGERIKVEIDVPSVALEAFPTLLAQVFVNLFTNAAQAIEGPGTVTVKGRVVGERVSVEVKDSGPGIPPENIPKLFEPFFTTKGVSGTGLGLALAYAYLEKHGGTIEARSEKGKGACFVIDMPLHATPGPDLGPRSAALFDAPRRA